ncbi:alpha/beta hydrolase [Tsukamurella sp. PLM1]|nr:alpha/beta hydrolase [Tsukamurella sp. PLM1]
MSTAERVGAGRYLAAEEAPAETTVTAHELTTADGATVAGLLRTVPDATAVAFLMHPRNDFSHHVLVPEFLRRGVAVWTQGSRTMGNDLTLLHEQALLDMAAGHVFLRDRGFGTVISVGHSGGCARRVLRGAGGPAGGETPEGHPRREAGAPGGCGDAARRPHGAHGSAPRAGGAVAAPHRPVRGRRVRPRSVDPALDPYSEANGFAPAPQPSSYSEEFLERYRAAQRARVERIDAVARERVARAREAQLQYKRTRDPADRRDALATELITVYRTDADPRCVDPAIDPNDRPYGSLFGSRPDLTDYGVVGFGRLTTPEAWLSTWSGLSSNAGFLRCAPAIGVPTLFIEITGDQACFPADARAMVEAIGTDDVEHVRVRGKHFGAALAEGEPTAAASAGAEIGRWLAQRV